VPDSKDNREERIARLDALMEEYRTKTEVMRVATERALRQSDDALKVAHAVLAGAQRRKIRGHR